MLMDMVEMIVYDSCRMNVEKFTYTSVDLLRKRSRHHSVLLPRKENICLKPPDPWPGQARP